MVVVRKAVHPATSPAPLASDVHIRYSSDDLEKASSFAEAFTSVGLRSELACFGEEIPSPQTVGRVVLIWSNAASKSPDARHEIEFAIKAWSIDKLTIFRVDDAELPLGLRDQPTFNLHSFD